MSPRFIADAMLGRLARWLRLLGYDTLYFSRIADQRLLELAWEEDRILLTRDTRLLRRRNLPPAVMVASNFWRQQLQQVVRECGLVPAAGFLCRCAVCNAELVPAAAAEVSGRVPPYVLQTSDRFNLCPGCGRVYWPATHRRQMEEVLRQLFGSPAAAGGDSFHCWKDES